MENVHILTHRASGRGDFLPLSAEYYRAENNEQNFNLVAKLQKTLEIHKLINIFSLEVAKLVTFNGLQFHGIDGVVEMEGSKHSGQTVSFDLEVESERLGQLIYFSKQSLTKPLTDKLEKLHGMLVYPLRNALLFNRVKKLATKDALTGLSNRSHFEDYLNKKLERCRRHHRNFGLMMLDLDNFKQVNDNHGHLLGDEILVNFGKILSSSVRGTDTVFRFGGDEFAILIDDNNQTVSNIIATRIQQFVHADNLLKQHAVTTSIGFTLAQSKDSNVTVVERADRALYQAKKAGRDCCKIL